MTTDKEVGLALSWKDGRVHGLRLRFKSFDDDTERYLFALVELEETGVIQQVSDRSLYSTHYGPGYQWIVDSYFDARKFDLLEAAFTPAELYHFDTIAKDHRPILNRFVEKGEGDRVLRIWRAHLGLMKSHFWGDIAFRDRGFKYEPRFMNVSETQQRASYDDTVSRLAFKKTKLLEALAEYRGIARSLGATSAEIARLEADMTAIRNETRPTYTGPRDTRVMDAGVFWELVGTPSQGPVGTRLEMLPDRLAAFQPAAIRKFDRILRETHESAYRTDVWALAYLLMGGCSDDSFDAFRGWLILQGRETFEGVLDAPDEFETAKYQGTASGMDGLRDAAPMAYQLRAGKPMKPLRVWAGELKGPDWTEEDFPIHLPRIAKAVDWTQ